MNKTILKCEKCIHFEMWIEVWVIPIIYTISTKVEHLAFAITHSHCADVEKPLPIYYIFMSQTSRKLTCLFPCYTESCQFCHQKDISNWVCKENEFQWEFTWRVAYIQLKMGVSSVRQVPLSSIDLLSMDPVSQFVWTHDSHCG